MSPFAELQLAPLTDAHAPEVARIQQECYGTAHVETLASLAAKWRAAPGTCRVALRAGAAVAYLIAVPVRFPALPAWNAPGFDLAPDADMLYLHDLAVSAAARGSGAGGTLVRAVLDAGLRAGHAQACLVAVQDSAAYWQGFGFRSVPAQDPALARKLATFGPQARLMQAPLA